MKTKYVIKNKMYITIVAILFFAGVAKAQSPYYTLAISNQTYTPLTGQTLLPIDTNISGQYINEPGLSFPLFGYPFIFAAYNNGLDSSNGAFVSWFGQVFLTDTVNNLTAMIDIANENGDQLITGETEISYSLTGLLGFRILKIQWKNIGSDTALNSTSRLNCQLWFMEQTNEIVMHYGNCNPGNPVDFKPSIDIILLSNTSYYIPGAAIISGTPGTETLTSYSNVTNFSTYSYILSNPFFTGAPLNGTMYRFTQASVGLNELKKDEIKIYPNPANETLYVHSNKNFEGKITDMNGKEVFSVSIKNGLTEIPIKTLTPGVYFLHTSYSQPYKFIKDK
jgi:hypothetical protein